MTLLCRCAGSSLLVPFALEFRLPKTSTSPEPLSVLFIEEPIFGPYPGDLMSAWTRVEFGL